MLLFFSKLSLDNYNEICDRAKRSLQKRVNNISLYNKEYLKTKMKFCERKTIFMVKKFLKNFHYICLSMILIDSALKNIKNIICKNLNVFRKM